MSRYTGLSVFEFLAENAPYQLYRYAMDGSRQDLPNHVQDWERTEQGSLSGVLNAYAYVMPKVRSGERLTVEDVLAIQRISISGVGNVDHDRSAGFKSSDDKKGFKLIPAALHAKACNVTDEGLKDIADTIIDRLFEMALSADHPMQAQAVQCIAGQVKSEFRNQLTSELQTVARLTRVNRAVVSHNPKKYFSTIEGLQASIAKAANAQQKVEKEIRRNLDNLPPLVQAINKLDGQVLRVTKDVVPEKDTFTIVMKIGGESNSLDGSKLFQRVQDRLNKIYDDLNSINDNDEKLQVIAKGVAELERIHPFKDANCRTFCMVVLNSLLMQYGFQPAIMENPNQFDGFSTQELVAQIKKGMEVTQALYHVIAKADLSEKEKFEVLATDQSDLESYANALTSSILPDPSRAVTSATASEVASNHDGIKALQLILKRFGRDNQAVVPRVFSSSLRLAAESGDATLLLYLLESDHVTFLNQEAVTAAFRSVSQHYSPNIDVIKKLLVLPKEVMPSAECANKAFISACAECINNHMNQSAKDMVLCLSGQSGQALLSRQAVVEGLGLLFGMGGNYTPFQAGIQEILALEGVNKPTVEEVSGIFLAHVLKKKDRDNWIAFFMQPKYEDLLTTEASGAALVALVNGKYAPDDSVLQTMRTLLDPSRNNAPSDDAIYEMLETAFQNNYFKVVSLVTEVKGESFLKDQLAKYHKNREGRLLLGTYPRENADATFDDYNVDAAGHQALKDQALGVMADIASFAAPRTITFIAGKPGCGKTQVSAALSHGVQAMGYDVGLLSQSGSSMPGSLTSNKNVKLVVVDDLPLPDEGEQYYTLSESGSRKSLQLYPGLQRLLDFATDDSLTRNNVHIVFTSNVKQNPKDIFSVARINADIIQLRQQGYPVEQLERLRNLLSAPGFKYLYAEAPSLRRGLADHVKRFVDPVDPVALLTDPKVPSGLMVVSETERERIQLDGKGVRKLSQSDGVGAVYDEQQKLWMISFDSTGARGKKPDEMAEFIRRIWEKGDKLIVVYPPWENVVTFNEKVRGVFQRQALIDAARHTGKEEGFLSRFDHMMVPGFDPKLDWSRQKEISVVGAHSDDFADVFRAAIRGGIHDVFFYFLLPDQNHLMTGKLLSDSLKLAAEYGNLTAFQSLMQFYKLNPEPGPLAEAYKVSIEGGKQEIIAYLLDQNLKEKLSLDVIGPLVVAAIKKGHENVVKHFEGSEGVDVSELRKSAATKKGFNESLKVALQGDSEALGRLSDFIKLQSLEVVGGALDQLAGGHDSGRGGMRDYPGHDMDDVVGRRGIQHVSRMRGMEYRPKGDPRQDVARIIIKHLLTKDISEINTYIEKAVNVAESCDLSNEFTQLKEFQIAAEVDELRTFDTTKQYDEFKLAVLQDRLEFVQAILQDDKLVPSLDKLNELIDFLGDHKPCKAELEKYFVQKFMTSAIPGKDSASPIKLNVIEQLETTKKEYAEVSDPVVKNKKLDKFIGLLNNPALNYRSPSLGFQFAAAVNNAQESSLGEGFKQKLPERVRQSLDRYKGDPAFQKN